MMSLARFDSGALGQFICSWAVEGGLDIRVELFGTEGTILLDQARSVNGVFAYSTGRPAIKGAGAAREDSAPGGPAPKRGAVSGTEASGAAPRPHAAAEVGWFYPLVDEWNVRGHRSELRHFVDCLIGGAEPISSLRRGLRALEVVQAVYRSAEKRAEVAVPRQAGQR